MTTQPKAKCARCGATDRLTKDHIIPKAMLKMFCVIEMNRAHLLQTLCTDCNRIKGNSLDPHNPRTMMLLRSLVERYEDLYVRKVSRRKYVFRTLSVTTQTPGTYYFAPCDPLCELQRIYHKQKNPRLFK